MIFPIFLSYSAHAAYVATLTLGLLLEKRRTWRAQNRHPLTRNAHTEHPYSQARADTIGAFKRSDSGSIIQRRRLKLLSSSTIRSTALTISSGFSIFARYSMHLTRHFDRLWVIEIPSHN